MTFRLIFDENQLITQEGGRIMDGKTWQFNCVAGFQKQRT